MTTSPATMMDRMIALGDHPHRNTVVVEESEGSMNWISTRKIAREKSQWSNMAVTVKGTPYRYGKLSQYVER